MEVKFCEFWDKTFFCIGENPPSTPKNGQVLEIVSKHWELKYFHDHLALIGELLKWMKTFFGGAGHVLFNRSMNGTTAFLIFLGDRNTTFGVELLGVGSNFLGGAAHKAFGVELLGVGSQFFFGGRHKTFGVELLGVGVPILCRGCFLSLGCFLFSMQPLKVSVVSWPASDTNLTS